MTNNQRNCICMFVHAFNSSINFSLKQLGTKSLDVNEMEDQLNKEDPPLEGAKLKNVEICNVDVHETIC